MTAVSLSDSHRRIIEASGISPEVAAARGYQTIEAKRGLLERGFPASQQLVPTLLIPVYDVKGDLATYQHRPDHPRLNGDGKVIKYETRARSKVVVDVPPAAREWLRDRDRPLFITEGSRKADAGVSKGLCTVALLGVWNWRDGDGALPDWEYIPVKDRKVYIAFDSDVMEKPAVHQALIRLRSFIEHRGATIRLVYLPPGPSGAKVGLDDFLFDHAVEDLLSHATSEIRRAPGKPKAPSAPVKPPARALAEVVDVYRRWMYLPDEAPLLAMLGAVVANRFAGPPVWLLLVAAPSSGKTEILSGLVGIPGVHLVSTLTEAALLSGTATKDRASDATGGLLRQIPRGGCMLLKDFTSVIAMNKDSRSTVLAALREVYDGRWARLVGVDGGRALEWEGKVGLVGGSTPAIDSAHAVMAGLGERFLLYRWGGVGEEESARAAISQDDEQAEARRAALGEAVAGLLLNTQAPAAPPPLDGQETDFLVTIARLAVRGRSAVERAYGASREILFVPPPEGPARMAQALHRLFGGMVAIGVDRRRAWEICREVALSSMPALRRAALDTLNRSTVPLRTARVGQLLNHPTSTVAVALEDLVAHALVERRADGDKEPGPGRAFMYSLADWTREALATGLPAATSYLIPSFTEKGDLSPSEESAKITAPEGNPESGKRFARDEPGADEADSRMPPCIICGRPGTRYTEDADGTAICESRFAGEPVPGRIAVVEPIVLVGVCAQCRGPKRGTAEMCTPCVARSLAPQLCLHESQSGRGITKPDNRREELTP
ncbi:MAG: DUF3854 domain-containing protein [Dehalococcoidia bacterium]